MARNVEARGKGVAAVKRILEKKNLSEEVWGQSSQFYMQTQQKQL
jgi:UDP:flavonoid glycosyltransferase YjiC (YdhE family)